MPTKEQRQDALAKASTEIAELYGSVALAQQISELNKKYGLLNGGEHVDVIGDVLLGLYPKNALSTLLSQKLQVPEATAAQIVTDLIPLLQKIPAGEAEVVPETSGEKQIQNPTPPTPNPITKEELVHSFAAPTHQTQAPSANEMRAASAAAADVPRYAKPFVGPQNQDDGPEKSSSENVPPSSTLQ